jgi:multidrug efflux pump subunit AcrA (membrane-fusion protein)
VSKQQNPEQPVVKKKAKKKRKWIKWVVLLVIAAAVVIFFRSRSGQTSLAGYEQETVTRRDIKTYHSFTGNITPVTEEQARSRLSGYRILTLNVEEGDEVKAGDVLATLDTSTLEESIKELEASMTTAQRTSALSIKSATQSYENYKYDLDNGLNQALLGAQSQIDSAYAQLLNAQINYNNEVALNNDGLSAAVVSSAQVDSAYLSYKQAQQQEVTALYTQAQKDKAVENAALAYNNAVAQYEQSKKQAERAEENKLDSLYDSVITARNSYLTALDNYNAIERSTSEQLQSLSTQLELSRAQADNSVNTLKLADLKSQLDDAVITAPVDGVITSLPYKKGDTLTGALATVTNFDTLKVDIKINEYDILGVSEGKDVEIIVDALDKLYEGKIRKISKVATLENGVSYFRSEVEFDADEESRCGMSVEVKLYTNDIEGALTLAADAVTTAPDGVCTVNVLSEDGKSLVAKEVKVGISNGTYIQILEGLSEGDVIWKPINYAARYGMTVE